MLVAGDDTPADKLLAVRDTRVLRIDLDAREPSISASGRRNVRWRGTAVLRFTVGDWRFHATDPGVA